MSEFDQSGASNGGGSDALAQIPKDRMDPLERSEKEADPALQPGKDPPADRAPSRDPPSRDPTFRDPPSRDPPSRDRVSARDPAMAALCAPISHADPCGPDLDQDGDPEYLNFLAHVEGILPSSFFSLEDGKPFDPAAIDFAGQLVALDRLMARTRDIRLLLLRARLLILNKDLAGFAACVAAAAHWLDEFWDAVHPRPEQSGRSNDPDPKSAAISALDMPTVVFALQYAPLFEVRRVGALTYRAWMIANGEVKPRAGDATIAAAAIVEALHEGDPEQLAAARSNVRLLAGSVDRIRNTCAVHGVPAGLESFSALVGKMSAFIDPPSTRDAAAAGGERVDDDDSPARMDPSNGAVETLASMAEAKLALAAVADYYSRAEPSSPTLPLVRQAHQLIGKSFLEVMTILVPSHVEKAAFQIGTDQGFELPVGRLSSVSGGAPTAPGPAAGEATGPAPSAGPVDFRVETRAQAIAVLGLVQRYFRQAEPSSPVPMLCERARSLAERDFMGVLKDVLPKSALKTITFDK